MSTFRVSSLTTEQVERVVKQRLIGRAELCEVLGITRQTLLKKVRRGNFPAPIGEFGKTFVWDITQVRPLFPKG